MGIGFSWELSEEGEAEAKTTFNFARNRYYNSSFMTRVKSS
jgi:hypothetical protein